MAVQITLDQSGKSPGIPGQARQDLATGTAVLCTSSGGPFLAYRWAVVSKAINAAVTVRSAAVFATPTADTSLLEPIDLPGTYLVRVTVDSGNGLGADEGDVAEIDFYAGPALASDPRRLPRRWPAAFEQLSHNVPDAIDPAGNTEGWAREKLKWKAIHEASVVWAAGLVENVNGASLATLIRGFGVSVSYIAAGQIQITFDTPMPDAFYSVIASIDDVNSAGADPSIVQPLFKDANGFQVWTYDVTINALADGVPFSFEVKLGIDP